MCFGYVVPVNSVSAIVLLLYVFRLFCPVIFVSDMCVPVVFVSVMLSWLSLFRLWFPVICVSVIAFRISLCFGYVVPVIFVSVDYFR